MHEVELTLADRARLKASVKLGWVLGVAVLAGLWLLILLIGGVVVLFFRNTMAPGMMMRGLWIMGGLSIPFLVLAAKSLIRLVDLRVGKKLSFTLTDYQVEQGNDGALLRSRSGVRLKESLYDGLVPLIRTAEPLHIETSKVSKELLFISHGRQNLLELAEVEKPGSQASYSEALRPSNIPLSDPVIAARAIRILQFSAGLIMLIIVASTVTMEINAAQDGGGEMVHSIGLLMALILLIYYALLIFASRLMLSRGGSSWVWYLVALMTLLVFGPIVALLKIIR